MLHLLVDTSTWLDLCKRRHGQRWIVALRALVHQGQVELFVPGLVVDEFERNRDRVETSMTASIDQRFKLIKQDLDDYGGTAQEEARKLIADLARHVPLIGAMTTRTFDEVLVLLQAGRVLEPGDEEKRRVVERGLSKQAPFHRSRNSVADALLIELYATVTRDVDMEREPYAFITSNSDDFSLPGGDARQPHPDLAVFFAVDGSTYGLGVDGLTQVLLDHFGEEIEELFAETYFEEEPRRLDEILQAVNELFDRIWYHRSLQREYRLEDAGDDAEIDHLLAIAGPARQRVEATYTGLVSLAHTRTSSWACSTASLRPCAGSSAAIGISSTHDCDLRSRGVQVHGEAHVHTRQRLMATSVVLTAAVSAIVAATVSALFKWGGQLAARARAWLRPDHAPLHAGEWQLYTSFADSPKIRVLIACAPTRSLRKQEVDPDLAIGFARSRSDSCLAPEPTFSRPQTGVKFQEAGQATDMAYLWIWAAGRVDYSTFVDTIRTDSGGQALPLVEVVDPIVTVARAMASREYRRLFPRRWAELPRRFDWFIAVGTHTRREGDEAPKPWTELAFPGPPPPRAAGEQDPFCPPQGYATEALRRWRFRGSVDELVTVFVDSFLKQNGYHQCRPAIADVIRAVS